MFGGLDAVPECFTSEQDNASTPAIIEAPDVQMNTSRKASPTTMDSNKRLVLTTVALLQLDLSKEWTLILR